jgi:hypothetical protein
VRVGMVIEPELVDRALEILAVYLLLALFKRLKDDYYDL